MKKAIVEDIPAAGNQPVVNTEQRRFYAASNFSTQFSGPDWRIYWVDGKAEGWLLRFTGRDAEIKAKAIAMILSAENTS